MIINSNENINVCNNINDNENDNINNGCENNNVWNV